ncbi:DUF1641 domain-containing protein [Sulfodiicoccus acidiphilus]|nr:DUF1641 domain-containing protein [Sulfodiicoccus acidiphilus]
MESLDLDKVMSKIDDKKLQEIADLLDELSTVNETLDKLREMKESGTLDALINFSYGLKSLRDLLNEDAVRNLSRYASNLLEFASSVDDETVQSWKRMASDIRVVEKLLARLNELNNNGTLDTLLEMAYWLKSLRDLLNEDAVRNLSEKVSSLLEVSSEMSELLKQGWLSKLNEVLSSQEIRDAVKDPPRVGLSGLIRMLSDPDVQKGMGIAMSILKAIGKRTGQQS